MINCEHFLLFCSSEKGFQFQAVLNSAIEVKFKSLANLALIVCILKMYLCLNIKLLGLIYVTNDINHLQFLKNRKSTRQNSIFNLKVLNKAFIG